MFCLNSRQNYENRQITRKLNKYVIRNTQIHSLIVPNHAFFDLRSWLQILLEGKESYSSSVLAITMLRTQHDFKHVCLGGCTRLHGSHEHGILCGESDAQHQRGCGDMILLLWDGLLLSGFSILSSIFLCFLFYWLPGAVTMAHSG